MDPVTFIVGAGASKPHNLPTGEKLKEMAVNLLRKEVDIYRLVRFALSKRDPKFNNDFLDSFRESLESHPGHSIDEFLEDLKTDKDVVTAGKAVIAAILGYSMLNSTIKPPPNEDWLRAIVNEMRDGTSSPDVFVANNIQTRFITFNFDAFIERRLQSFIYESYRSTTTNQFLPVVHVHGMLECPPDPPMMLDRGAHNPMWVDWLAKSIDRINVTSDAIGASVLDKARAIISDSSILCFLGFSYNDVNVVDRLGLPKTLKSGVEVYGTAMGLSETKVSKIQKRFSPATIHLLNSNCRGIFDKWAILR